MRTRQELEKKMALEMETIQGLQLIAVLAPVSQRALLLVQAQGPLQLRTRRGRLSARCVCLRADW